MYAVVYGPNPYAAQVVIVCCQVAAALIAHNMNRNNRAGKKIGYAYHVIKH